MFRKLIDKFMRLFGYERVNLIKIKPEFLKHQPGYTKMWVRRLMYRYDRTLYADIVLDKDGYLVDGYTSYLIAKEYNLKYVKVKREVKADGI